MSKNHYIFIGNPGAGKSTLLNSQFCALKFKSGLGIGNGSGLTQIFSSNQKGNNIYIDVPGLADNNLLEAAAQEITKALKLDGIYKVIFVVDGNGLRVSPEDLSTLRVVLNSLVEIQNLKYALVLNKCGRTAIERVNGAKQTWIDNYCGLLPVKATDIFAYPMDPNAYDANDVLIPCNESFKNWLDGFSS